jgi:hypothetical protein
MLRLLTIPVFLLVLSNTSLVEGLTFAVRSSTAHS